MLAEEIHKIDLEEARAERLAVLRYLMWLPS